MLRCSKNAYAQCPDHHLCGSIEEATFMEGSKCDKFNREVEEKDAERKWYPCEHCISGTYRSCEGCSYGEKRNMDGQ